ncbi:hypothetical protein GCM10027456_30770 [Kineosporia babensis]
MLADQQTGDQESGQDEEDVHAEKAAAGAEFGVVEQNDEDGDRAQALDVSPERRRVRRLRPVRRLWCLRGFVAGCPFHDLWG